jgi:beta-glucosidase
MGIVRSKVEELIGKMTLEEKIAQLGSVSIGDLLEEGRFSAEKARRVIPNGIGQITRIAGWAKLAPKETAELANEVQRFLRENTRLGIPAIVHEECLSGLMAHGATTYPQAIGLASTWEPELIRRMTSAIRREMRAVGAHQGLSPVLDVLRDPRWGRVEETLGEDHYLVACMGVAYVKGLQGDDLREGVIATVKHFAAHGFPEGGRNWAPVHTGVREFREVFLFPFEAAVKAAGVKSVMNAYHDLDGVPCAASKELLSDILRGEWEFDGIVVSDYGAIDMLRTTHHTAADKKEAAIQALEAGIDIELPGINCYGKPLLQAAREGVISEALIDEAVRRVLIAKMALGLFENPFVDPEKAPQVFDAPEHRSLALEIARKSIILLKNEGGLLPLSKDLGSIAVIGPNADSARNLLGDYTFMAHLSLEETAIPIASVLDGIKAKVSEGTTVRYAKGCEVFGGTKEGFAEAIKIAESSDVAIVVVGGKSGLSGTDTCGEFRDRSDLGLPGYQGELVEAICATGRQVVVVLINGRPFSIEWIAENVNAIVETWLPGEEGGNAIADVLFGDYNPGGKLPISVPRTVGQIPINYNRKPASHRDYVFVKGTPLFPFGHGLSYTSFEYSDLEISPAQIPPAGQVTISLKVKNVGDREGDEVVQLYVRDVVASTVRPVKELKGFKRVALKPGEGKKVTFKLSADQLAFYDRDVKLVVEPGTFEVMVGGSSEEIRLKGSFEVVGRRREIVRRRKLFTEVAVSDIPLER